MMPVWFHPDARAEAVATVRYYEHQQSGLGKRFRLALGDLVSGVQAHPLMYPLVENEIRRCRIPRFPYGVVFRMTQTAVEIIAVMHLRREPGYWRTRAG